MKNLEAPSSATVKRLVSLNGKSMSIHNFTDEELVAKYKASRDHQYLTELFTRHSDVIYRNALRKMKNPADAEDILQIAYIKMVTDLLNFKGTGSVIGWMLQVVIFTCYDRLRSEKSRQNRDKKIMSERTQMTTPKNYELTEMIETHLNKLPEIYKLPITLQIMDGLTVKEVSDTLNIPEKTIRSQIARGLEKLKASLQSVGVTASVISVGDMLKEIQQPVVPEIFKSNQYFNSLFQAKAATSTKLAITAGSKAFVFNKVFTVSLYSLITITTLILGFNFFNSKAPLTTFIKSQQWDFENNQNLSEYQSIGLVPGAIYLAESRGVNGSSALMTNEDTLIEIDISKFQFPLKLSYKTDVLVTKDRFVLQRIFRKNYLKDQKLFHLYDLYEKINFSQAIINENAKFGYVGKWVSCEAYIDEDSVDCWFNGVRGYFFQGKSNDKNKLFISSMGKSIIDDLTIESINKNDIPDKKLCESAVEDLEYKDDVNLYSVDKQKLGMEDSGKFQPKLEVSTVETFESLVPGLNKEVSYPFLNEKNKVEWVSERQKMKVIWDFEDKNDLLKFTLKSGSLVQVGKIGVNDTSCMGIDEYAFIELDISKFKLPIKISYNYDNFIPKSGQTNLGILMLKDNCLKDKNIFNFIKISPTKRIDLYDSTKQDNNRQFGFFGEWFSANIYITEEYIDLWFHGNRTSFLYAKSNENKKLYFQIREKSIIDNFIIESVEEESIPDASKFTKFVATIPFVKGFKKYYKLDKEKELLGIDKSSEVELGIWDSATVEKVYGLHNNNKIVTDTIDTEEKRKKSSMEFLSEKK